MRIDCLCLEGGLVFTTNVLFRISFVCQNSQHPWGNTEVSKLCIKGQNGGRGVLERLDDIKRGDVMKKTVTIESSK